MGKDYISQLGLNTGRFGDVYNQTLLPSTGTTAPMLSGLAATYAPAPEATGLWDQTKGLLSDKNFMSGLQGVGTLGLGLANYMTMKPVYEEQLKGLKQNRQFAAENQQNRKNIASDLGG